MLANQNENLINNNNYNYYVTWGAKAPSAPHSPLPSDSFWPPLPGEDHFKWKY